MTEPSPPAPCVPDRRAAPLRSILALMVREMSSRYGRSAGGFAWAIVEPLGVVLLLALGFSLLFKAPPLGTSFLLFYATASVPFHLYQSVSVTVARALRFNGPLLRYPAVSWIDAVIARFLLNALAAIAAGVVILGGILALQKTGAVLQPEPILLATGLAALIGLGVGVVNCLLIGRFETWDMIWSIATRPLFLASGILFTYEGLPAGVQALLWFNPLLHVTALMREGFYPMYAPGWASPLYAGGCGLAALAIGLVLLRRFHEELPER
jgi:capsular polysaccharide transport system permease protein